VSNDNGRTKLEWNAPTATSYYGYDTGQVSSELRAGVTLTKPLTGGALYRAERQQMRISDMAADNTVRLNTLDIERSVTDQYLLCRLDLGLIDYIDSLRRSVSRQYDIIKKMAEHGLAKQSDLTLLQIELLNNDERRQEAWRNYRSHIGDLNALCGISDTAIVLLADENVTLRPRYDGTPSPFDEKYRIDSLAICAKLNTWNARYKPQLSFFANGGMNTADINKTLRRFGVSAGVTFSWLLFDGKQKRSMERQTAADLNTVAAYRDNFMAQRRQMLSKYTAQISEAEAQAAALKRQLDEYDRLTLSYQREMQHGNVSAVDYITVMRNRLQTAYNLLTLQTNVKLMINALNYWNY